MSLLDILGKKKKISSSLMKNSLVEMQEQINRLNDRSLLNQAQQAQQAQQNQINSASQQAQQAGLGQVVGGGGGWLGGVGSTAAGSSSGGSANVNNMINTQTTEKKKIKNREISVDVAKTMVQNVLKTPIVPFLWGPPGVGKSSIIREICEENDWDLIDLRLSLLNPVDLRGLPVLDKKSSLARWFAPSFLPTVKSKKRGILFLDEINLAPLSVQAAAYQLILDKKVGEYTFPKHWMIVAAGNRETDKANVYKISAPLANRFIHLTVVPNFDTWERWAEKNNTRKEVLEFLKFRPVLLFQPPKNDEKSFPTPRSWQFLSDILNAYSYDTKKGIDEDLEEVIRGTIGEGTAKEFVSFINDYSNNDVKDKIDEYIKTGKIKLPDTTSVRWALISGLYEAHQMNKLSDEKYKKFLDMITGEEKRSIEEFEEEEDEKIKSQYGSRPKV